MLSTSFQTVPNAMAQGSSGNLVGESNSHCKSTQQMGP